MGVKPRGAGKAANKAHLKSKNQSDKLNSMNWIVTQPEAANILNLLFYAGYPAKYLLTRAEDKHCSN